MSAITAEVYMEEGVARLEPRIERIESDVATLKVSVQRLDDKVERLDEKVEQLDERVGGLDEKVERLDGKVDDLGIRMTAMETQLVGVRENQSSFLVDLRELRHSLDAKFIWILTAMIAFGMALLAAMAKGFHWLK